MHITRKKRLNLPVAMHERYKSLDCDTEYGSVSSSSFSMKSKTKNKTRKLINNYIFFFYKYVTVPNIPLMDINIEACTSANRSFENCDFGIRCRLPKFPHANS